METLQELAEFLESSGVRIEIRANIEGFEVLATQLELSWEECYFGQDLEMLIREMVEDFNELEIEE